MILKGSTAPHADEFGDQKFGDVSPDIVLELEEPSTFAFESGTDSGVAKLCGDGELFWLFSVKQQ